MNDSITQWLWKRRIQQIKEEMDKIRALSEKGMSVNEIAKQYGLSKERVKYILSEGSPRL